MEYSECKQFEQIQFRFHQQICYIGLHNPSKQNALSRTLIREFLEALHLTEKDFDCRALVIYGEGKNFCAGADLDWMLEGKSQTRQQNVSDAKLFFDLYEHLYNYPKPVISVVKKSVYGGGIGLLACSDIVIAEENVKLRFPEVSLGLVPATIAPFVAKKTGSSFTRRMMLTGELFSADMARRAGLITDIVPDGETDRRLDEILQLLRQNGPQATIWTKQMINHFEDNHEIDDLMAVYCTKLIASARASEEGQEGVKAFFEKRKCNWNHDHNKTL